MPVITLYTNVPRDQDFDTKLALAIAGLCPDCFNKAAERAQVIINSGTTMTMAGTADPCACLKIVSIGTVTPDENKVTCAKMTELIASECKIDPGRIFVDMFDVSPDMIGKGG